MIYEQALKPRRTLAQEVLYRAWCWFGLGALFLFSWMEPFSQMALDAFVARGMSAWIADYVLLPLVMFIRGILLVEFFGYLYHRWFQHVSWMTRRAYLIRKSQRYHWIHHMIIYPIGTIYKRAQEYAAAEKGIAWTWSLPGLLLAGLFLFQHGISIATVTFIAAVAWYAKCVISKCHKLFHVKGHKWAGSKYFKWLEDIHLLHHWDQRCNFTIVNPLMDKLFGTYLNPKEHQAELNIAAIEDAFTVSDMINWRYLLLEANPEEYAAYISEAKEHKKSIKKLEELICVLGEEHHKNPHDPEVKLLLKRAKKLESLLN